MKILILNQDWFVEEFRAMGHEVVSCGIAKHLDIVLPVPLLHLDFILKEHWNGTRPDVILILDNSAPISISGIEETDIPCVFYAVDTHHHGELHSAISQVVDYVYMAQKDYIPSVRRAHSAPIEWLPLWASRYVEAEDEKKHGAAFVGSLRRELQPERVEFFEKLQELVPVLCQTGPYWNIFPFSEIVVNQTAKGDLNFRVFESMMCGSMLLTEWSRNGLLELFEAGTHLVTYRKGDVQDAAEKIQYYLDHPEECREIARRGREEVLRNHLPQHRADHVIRRLESVTKRARSKHHFLSWMINCNGLAVRLWKLDTELAESALVHTLKSAEAAYALGEELDEHFAFPLTLACCQFDQMRHSRAGIDLLKRFSDRFPNILLLRLALIRDSLNRGDRSTAYAVANEIAGTDSNQIFQAAEEAVTSLMRDVFV